MVNVHPVAQSTQTQHPMLHALDRSAQPLDVQRLRFGGGDLWFALVNPLFEAPTAEMRAALPKEVSMAAEIHNAAMGGTLVRSTSALQFSALSAVDIFGAHPVGAVRRQEHTFLGRELACCSCPEAMRKR